MNCPTLSEGVCQKVIFKFGEKLSVVIFLPMIVWQDYSAGTKLTSSKNTDEMRNETHTEQLVEIGEDGTLQCVRGEDGKVKRRDEDFRHKLPTLF